MNLLEQLDPGCDVLLTAQADDGWVVEQVRALLGGDAPVVVLGAGLERLKRLELALRAGRVQVHALRSGVGPVLDAAVLPGKTDILLIEQRWLPLYVAAPARAWLLLDDVVLFEDSPQVKALVDARHHAPTIACVRPECLSMALQVLCLHQPRIITALPERTTTTHVKHPGPKKVPVRRAADDEPQAQSTIAAQVSQAAEDAIVFETLRVWRANRARNEGIPAYRVFSNRQLQALIAAHPKSKEEFLSVPGIGPHAWDAYGQEVLSQLSVG